MRNPNTGESSDVENVEATHNPAGDRTDDITAQIVVLGAGPGGYTAAFRAADLGQQVVLIDAGDTLGGVCLNVGCIPSKALLHAAKVIADAADMTDHGVSFSSPNFDLDRLRDWKNGVVTLLTGGSSAWPANVASPLSRARAGSSPTIDCRSLPQTAATNWCNSKRRSSQSGPAH